MTIGALAREAGVGVETVRFYERQGLLEKPPRAESGYRRYPPETAVRLRFIRHAKELGFSLLEIRELLSLRSSTEASCSDVRRQIWTKIEDVQKRIGSLERMRKTLEKLAAICTTGAPTSECPILEVLEGSVKEEA